MSIVNNQNEGKTRLFIPLPKTKERNIIRPILKESYLTSSVHTHDLLYHVIKRPFRTEEEKE